MKRSVVSETIKVRKCRLEMNALILLNRIGFYSIVTLMFFCSINSFTFIQLFSVLHQLNFLLRLNFFSSIFGGLLDQCVCLCMFCGCTIDVLVCLLFSFFYSFLKILIRHRGLSVRGDVVDPGFKSRRIPMLSHYRVRTFYLQDKLHVAQTKFVISFN